MNIPERCIVMERINNDGKNPEEVMAAVAKGSNDEILIAMGKIGFDSLDVVELGMEAEECAKCDSGSGAAHCDIGALLIDAGK